MKTSWVTYGCNCAQPAFDYFKLKFSTDLKPVVDAFRAARYISPSKLSELLKLAMLDVIKYIIIYNARTL